MPLQTAAIVGCKFCVGICSNSYYIFLTDDSVNNKSLLTCLKIIFLATYCALASFVILASCKIHY